MGARTFHQYFGPSPRHDRACVEIRFDREEATRSLAPFAPLLRGMGFKLHVALRDEPLPHEAAVARLANALLSRYKPWWTGHGSEGMADGEGSGWAAMDFPLPIVAASALEVAFLLLARGGDLPPPVKARLAELSGWLAGTSKIRLWMTDIAGTFARETAIVGARSDVYQVGQGSRGVQFFRVASQFDSLLAPMIEGDKFTTVQLLRRFGLPTTNAVLVKQGDALAPAIAQVGLPCVVKPLNRGRGVGVVTSLGTEAAVAEAVRHAVSVGGRQVQIENHIEGDDHRLIVINDELLFAYRKVRASVVGDGDATVGELIARVNSERDANYSRADAYMDLISIDEELRQFLAARHAVTLDTVLENGRQIEVVSQGNTSRGAYLDDATGRTHPDNRELAIRLARLFRLKTTGIDFITPDISRSWKEIPCAVVEVNRTPGLSGFADAVTIHRSFFRNRTSGMIPTVAMIGEPAYCARMAEAFGAAFRARGLRPASAAYSGRGGQAGTQFSPVDRAVEALWLDPEADAAVIQCEPDGVEAFGLPLRRCDLLVVEDGSRFAWLTGHADAVVSGAMPQATIDRAAAELVRRYGDPDEGGPVPVLEPIGGEGEAHFRLKVWRARAMPRAWFWDQVGIAPANRSGLTTHDDLLGAVHALAAEALGGKAGLPPFEHGELLPSWACVTFESAIALPQRNRAAAAAALAAAVDRVNAIAALPIG